MKTTTILNKEFINLQIYKKSSKHKLMKIMTTNFYKLTLQFLHYILININNHLIHSARNYQ